MVEVKDASGAGLAPSVFLHGMHGSFLPIVTAHGEGQATFDPSPTALSTPQTLIGLNHLLGTLRNGHEPRRFILYPAPGHVHQVRLLDVDIQQDERV